MRKPTKLHITMDAVFIKQHRYASIDDYKDPTIIGDWINFHTTVADMGNTDYEFLVFMHAIIEQYLCWKHGIKDKQITKFDMDHPEFDDPGNEDEAPYHKEHMIANDIESMLSVALGVDWKKYSMAIDKTLKKYKKKK